MKQATDMNEIRDYFLIGDLHTAALVSKDGSIDWLCLPHFDSASTFSRILDKNGGCFSIYADGYKTKARYAKRTAIVEIVFQNNGNKFFVKDFMVPQPRNVCDSHFLVRKITGLSGLSKVKIVFNPRPNYAKASVKITKQKSMLEVNNKGLVLYLPKGTRTKKVQEGYELEIEIKEGQTKEFILEHTRHAAPHRPKRDFEYVTKNFWKKWVSKGRFFNFCKEQLIRSAITMKLMQFYPTGAIVAAPTTSLPEEIGGIRNWDYRYVWIRDATFTLYGLHVLGYKEEAQKFFRFIEPIIMKCVECAVHVKPLYTIQGEEVPKEKILKHFSGYENSRPVRIGNNAARQFQLDIYGTLIDSYYFMKRRGVHISDRGKRIITSFVDRIASRWKEKGNGIWEVRNELEDFTYGKVMAWVGVNRALRLCDFLKITEEKRKEWEKLEKEIKEWIWKNCYNKKLRTFTQYPGTKHQDATNFLFVLLQFLDKRDPLTKTIIKNTCKELLHNKIFVYRYLSADGLKGEEGAFVLCTFWLISALAIIEDVKKAEKIFRLFEKRICSSGLLSEEIEPETSKYLGNFPQVFSHLGYIMSAFYINKYSKRQKKE